MASRRRRRTNERSSAILARHHHKLKVYPACTTYSCRACSPHLTQSHAAHPSAQLRYLHLTLSLLCASYFHCRNYLLPTLCLLLRHASSVQRLRIPLRRADVRSVLRHPLRSINKHYHSRPGNLAVDYPTGTKGELRPSTCQPGHPSKSIWLSLFIIEASGSNGPSCLC